MTVLAHRQEILAEDIDEVPGALWRQQTLDETRVTAEQVPPLVRVVVSLDPAGSSQETSDEMGIVVGGIDARGHGYTLCDASRRGTPAVCARQAILLYDHYQADALIAESNNGGEWIGTVVAFVAAEMCRQGERASARINYKMVHASRGKVPRAEPVSAEFEHGRCHHAGYFPALEAEMTGWVPGMPSPSRMDSAVWLYHELLLGSHVPRDLSLRPALDGMSKRSGVAIGDEPAPPSRFQGDRMPRTWPGGASRPRFGGRTWADDFDDDRYG
jgi:phage terminase large subunit-like protein